MLVGPALQNVHERRAKQWLYKFIKNPQGMVKSNDSIAVTLYKDYNELIMPSFTSLTDAEIDSILVHIKFESVVYY